MRASIAAVAIVASISGVIVPVTAPQAAATPASQVAVAQADVQISQATSAQLAAALGQLLSIDASIISNINGGSGRTGLAQFIRMPLSEFRSNYGATKAAWAQKICGDLGTSRMQETAAQIEQFGKIGNTAATGFAPHTGGGDLKVSEAPYWISRALCLDTISRMGVKGRSLQPLSYVNAWTADYSAGTTDYEVLAANNWGSPNTTTGKHAARIQELVAKANGGGSFTAAEVAELADLSLRLFGVNMTAPVPTGQKEAAAGTTGGATTTSLEQYQFDQRLDFGSVAKLSSKVAILHGEGYWYTTGDWSNNRPAQITAAAAALAAAQREIAAAQLLAALQEEITRGEKLSADPLVAELTGAGAQSVQRQAQQLVAAKAVTVQTPAATLEQTISSLQAANDELAQHLAALRAAKAALAAAKAAATARLAQLENLQQAHRDFYQAQLDGAASKTELDEILQAATQVDAQLGALLKAKEQAEGEQTAGADYVDAAAPVRGKLDTSLAAAEAVLTDGSVAAATVQTACLELQAALEALVHSAAANREQRTLEAAVAKLQAEIARGNELQENPVYQDIDPEMRAEHSAALVAAAGFGVAQGAAVLAATQTQLAQHNDQVISAMQRANQANLKLAASQAAAIARIKQLSFLTAEQRQRAINGVQLGASVEAVADCREQAEALNEAKAELVPALDNAVAMQASASFRLAQPEIQTDLQEAITQGVQLRDSVMANAAAVSGAVKILTAAMNAVAASAAQTNSAAAAADLAAEVATAQKLQSNAYYAHAASRSAHTQALQQAQELAETASVAQLTAARAGLHAANVQLAGEVDQLAAQAANRQAAAAELGAAIATAENLQADPDFNRLGEGVRGNLVAALQAAAAPADPVGALTTLQEATAAASTGLAQNKANLEQAKQDATAAISLYHNLTAAQQAAAQEKVAAATSVAEVATARTAAAGLQQAIGLLDAAVNEANELTAGGTLTAAQNSDLAAKIMAAQAARVAQDATVTSVAAATGQLRALVQELTGTVSDAELLTAQAEAKAQVAALTELSEAQRAAANTEIAGAETVAAVQGVLQNAQALAAAKAQLTKVLAQVTSQAPAVTAAVAAARQVAEAPEATAGLVAGAEAEVQAALASEEPDEVAPAAAAAAAGELSANTAQSEAEPTAQDAEPAGQAEETKSIWPLVLGIFLVLGLLGAGAAAAVNPAAK